MTDNMANGPTLNLPEELILMLLNEQTGHFHQVPGWTLNCAVAGAVLAELSLRSRIDTDLETLTLLDGTPTGDPAADPILEEIAADPEPHNAQFWIERLAAQTEWIIDRTLDRLVEIGIIEHHDGDFWTLSAAFHEGAVQGFIKTRVAKALFTDEIPDPRDIIVISLIDTCGVSRFIFELDEEAEERIAEICRMDLIARSIAAAVEHNVASPLLRRPTLTKKIPIVSLRDLVFNRELREGRLPAAFAILADKYGPVYEIRLPFRQNMIVLAGLNTNQWAHRMGRVFLRSKDYFADVDKAYGVSRSIHSVDGADHFRFRKSMSTTYSRNTLTKRLDEAFDLARAHMATWDVGTAMPAQAMLRKLLNAQTSPLFASINTQSEIIDALDVKVRVLNVGIVKTTPRFMLKTPSMRRKMKVMQQIIGRMQKTHTIGQRAGKHKDVVDGYLALHASDPQFLPESDLPLPLGSILMTGMYMGDQIGFALYWLLQNPELYERVTAEADALWAEGDPSEDDLSRDRIDVTHRVLMETLRMSPIVPMSVRTVMNSITVEGYELPVGAQLLIAQTATHYSEEVFPDPWTFDIDRYLPPRNEHLSRGYAPFGLGTHSCLGSHWAELQMAINLLMLTRYFKIELVRPFKRLPMDPLPSQSPSNKIKFRLAEQRHELLPSPGAG